MSGVNKNIRRLKKINKALPEMDDCFTSYDLSSVTGISPRMCGVLLRRFDEVVNIGPQSGMKATTWRKTR